MEVKIENHGVHIQGGGFAGPYVNLDLSPQDAYTLLRRLEEKRIQLHDLATNYYDCRECGETHHNSLRICPTLEK